MRLLIDTHAFLWWLDGDRRLKRGARRLIADEDNAVLVSAASAWEIATKFRLGKLDGAAEVAADIGGAVASQGFVGLHITVRHAEMAGSLAGPLRDPFDRMLIAQCHAEGLPVVSIDTAFDVYGVSRLWD